MRDVVAQPFEALLLMHGGMTAGLCYLLLRTARSRTNRRVWTHLCDAAFVLLHTVILTGYLYLANFLTVRLFLIAAYALGFFAAYALFGPIFARMTQKFRKK